MIIIFSLKLYIAEKLILRISAQELTNGKKKTGIELQQNHKLNKASKSQY